MAFHERLRRAWYHTGSMLCVGLDPDPQRLPEAARGSVFDFCAAIVDATADTVCAFKPQIAYFAAVGAEAELERLCVHIRDRHPDVLLVLDAKRGDIGSTAEQYAKEAFDRYGADVVTVNPYLGGDTVEPYLHHPHGGVFVLCRTSNPGSGDFQSLDVGGELLYQRVARRVVEWNDIGDCGLVVGATYPGELADVRAIVGDLPLLVPGIGAQGGDVVATVAAGQDSTGYGMVINSSRAILYASNGDDFADAARAEALATRRAIDESRT
jgi:orotidine-5'-phosphate decarboxylase